MVVGLGGLGQVGGAGGAGMGWWLWGCWHRAVGQGGQGWGCSPLNSFLRNSRSCARPRGSIRSSLKLKPQRSTRSFVGVVTLRTMPALGLAASSPWLPARPRRAGGWRSLRGRLRGGVHGPVRGVVRDPGVAGQAAGHDGVVRHVLLVELEVPARSGGWRWPGPPAHHCRRPQPPQGRGRVTEGTCLGSAMTTEVRLRSPPGVTAAPAAGSRDAGAPVTPGGDAACRRGSCRPLTPPGRWRTSLWSWPWPSGSTRSGARRGDVRGDRQPASPGAAPAPCSTHLPLVVIHVLGLREMHGDG